MKPMKPKKLLRHTCARIEIVMNGGPFDGQFIHLCDAKDMRATIPVHAPMQSGHYLLEDLGGFQFYRWVKATTKTEPEAPAADSEAEPWKKDEGPKPWETP